MNNEIPLDMDEPESYEQWTRRPLLYYPAYLQGELMGFLWASKNHHSAGFIRRLATPPPADPLDDRSLMCSFFWDERLQEAYAQGLSPIDALNRWKGAPETPEGGVIPADSAPREASSLSELNDIANPNGPVLTPGPLVQDGELPDGTPADRSHGWEPRP